ncbi:MAG: hypothetical protein K0S12_1478, partial [Bacteroidetes bacterium]|nr:hypothetical protein [Bacteroidota bacterium]
MISQTKYYVSAIFLSLCLMGGAQTPPVSIGADDPIAA